MVGKLVDNFFFILSKGSKRKDYKCLKLELNSMVCFDLGVVRILVFFGFCIKC